MHVRDWLKDASDSHKEPATEAVSEGDRFDGMSVRRSRHNAFGQGL